MIKLCLSVSDVIRVNKLKLYVNCGLHVNFWKFWLMLFSLMMKKDHSFQAKFYTLFSGSL